MMNAESTSNPRQKPVDPIHDQSKGRYKDDEKYKRSNERQDSHYISAGT